MNNEDYIEISVEEAKRIDYMLKVASEYILNNYPDGSVNYDGTDCDGYCVSSDLESLTFFDDTTHLKEGLE